MKTLSIRNSNRGYHRNAPDIKLKLLDTSIDGSLVVEVIESPSSYDKEYWKVGRIHRNFPHVSFGFDIPRVKL